MAKFRFQAMPLPMVTITEGGLVVVWQSFGVDLQTTGSAIVATPPPCTA